MSTTPKGFRYPVLTDTPDVPRDLGYLATSIDDYLTTNKGPGYLVFSTTSQTVATGSKSFSVTKTVGNPNGSGAYTAGDRVRVISSGTITSWVEGTITSVTLDTTIVVNVDTINGSGTFVDWKFSLTGIQGLQGPQGPQGTQGVQGVQGPQGTQGIQGVQGPQGTQGVQGVQGPQGTQGIQGVQGTQGTQGVQGVQGTQGIQGSGYSVTTSTTSNTIGTGSKTFAVTNSGAYINGDRVRVISQGSPTNFIEGTITALTVNSSITVLADMQYGTGAFTDWKFSIAGVQGVQGTQGVQGPQGTQGIQGVQGPQGTQGVQGVQGPQGTQGIQGVQGTQGTQGVQGTQGTQGTQGIQGIQGISIQGTAGIAGQTNAHPAINAVSTNNGAGSSTYFAGSADVESGTGIGAYIEANANGVIPTIDGVTLAVGNRVLFTGRANSIENGIYSVTNLGSGSTKYRFTRATDSDNHVAAQVEPGDYVFALTGTLYANSTWVLYSTGSNPDGSIKIGTDPIQFTQAGGIGAQGTVGPQGTQGVQGNQGVQGIQGLGYAQLQGTQGIQGLQGNQGTQGVQGPQGTQGTQGLQGLQGNQGTQGLQGIQGTTYNTPTIGQTQITSGATISGLQGLTLQNTILQGTLTANGTTGTSGYLLTSTGTGVQWAAAPISLPAQTGNNNKILTTDGTSASWTGAPTLQSIITTGDVTVGGNLSVQGTVTTVSSSTLTVADKNIELAKSATPTDTLADGGGLTLHGTTDKTFNWYNTTQAWTTSENFDIVSGKTILIGGIQGTSGQYLKSTGSGLQWATVDALPSQTGAAGKFLTTNGSVASWGIIDVSSTEINTIMGVF